MLNIAVIAIAIAVACLTINTFINNLAIAKMNSLLHSDEGMQKAVAEMVYERIRSEKITFDSKAVQQAICDKVSEVSESSNRIVPE